MNPSVSNKFGVSVSPSPLGGMNRSVNNRYSLSPSPPGEVNRSNNKSKRNSKVCDRRSIVPLIETNSRYKNPDTYVCLMIRAAVLKTSGTNKMGKGNVKKGGPTADHWVVMVSSMTLGSPNCMPIGVNAPARACSQSPEDEILQCRIYTWGETRAIPRMKAKEFLYHFYGYVSATK